MKTSNETYRQILYKEISSLAHEIKKWDKEDIYSLMRDIKELNQLILDYNFSDLDHDDDQGTDIQYWLDLSDIPTEPVPDEVSDYPVWLVDKKGFALVGEAADEIQPVSEVLGWYRER